MIKKTLFVVALLSSILPSLNAVGSGRAIIPCWGASHGHSNTSIYVTNISNTRSLIKITLYDYDGTVYTEATNPEINFRDGGGFSAGGMVLSGNPLSPRGELLAANHSGYASIWIPDTFHFGYGVIEWSSKDNKPESIIAHVVRGHGIGNDETSDVEYIPINNHRPF